MIMGLMRSVSNSVAPVMIDDEDEEEDDDEITHGSLHRSLSGSAQKKKRKIQGAGSDADLPQGLGNELGEADQYNDPVSQFTKMFQSCSQNAAKKSVTEKGSTPPAAVARAATCKLPAIRLFSTAPAGITPSCKSGVMIAADDGVIKKEIMNPGETALVVQLLRTGNAAIHVCLFLKEVL